MRFCLLIDSSLSFNEIKMPNYEEDYRYTRDTRDSCNGNRRKRKHDRVNSDERSAIRSRSRSPNSARRHRRYRGSSGTRALKRSYDRAVRLKEYYEKKYENGHSDSENRGSRKAGSKRKGDSFEYSSSYNNNNRKSRSRSSSNTHHSASSSSHVKDDKDGHLIYKAGDWLQNRYKVKSLLGEGTFGKCLECYDRKRDEVVAMKIIKNIQKYRDAAKLEIKVLQKLKKKDPTNKNYCIELLGAFNYHGHVCLVFPKLGKSVFDFTKENNYQPLSIEDVRHIALQLLISVKFLHSIKLTHTDLKPENMMFVDGTYDKIYNDKKQCTHVLKNPDICLIDFGSATFSHEHHSKIVSTRHYRAPEVILELGWSFPCDIWSCGCIIYELYTGNTLFQTHDNREHLAMMTHILGPLPKDMIKKSRHRKNYFRDGELDWKEDSADGQYVRDNCKPLKKYRCADGELHYLLFDLLKKLLRYDQNERYLASEAVKHPFFD